ncbi:MAG: DUF1456 family protein [Bacilli bacterium]
MKLHNHDRIIRLRYALDIRDVDMLDIFKLGGAEKTKEEVAHILAKTKRYGEAGAEDEVEKCDDMSYEAFLNGLITFKRGPKPGEEGPLPIVDIEHPNNSLLKKAKIALSLTTDDMIAIFYDAGLIVSKSELGALMRKKGHKNYKICGDNFARNFLKGLAMRYR